MQVIYFDCRRWIFNDLKYEFVEHLQLLRMFKSPSGLTHSMIKYQVDLRYEAHALDKFVNNFAENPNIRFPRPVRPYCKRDVLVETFEVTVDFKYMLYLLFIRDLTFIPTDFLDPIRIAFMQFCRELIFIRCPLYRKAQIDNLWRLCIEGQRFTDCAALAQFPLLSSLGNIPSAGYPDSRPSQIDLD